MIKDEIAKGRTSVERLDFTCIQSASVDIHLDNKLLAFRTWLHPFSIDGKQNIDGLSELVVIGEDKPFLLNAGEFALAGTLELTSLPDDIMAQLEGNGHLRVELSNVAKLPVTLCHETLVGQVSFLRLTSPMQRVYGSPGSANSCQGQSEPTATGCYKDFAKER